METKEKELSPQEGKESSQTKSEIVNLKIADEKEPEKTDKSAPFGKTVDGQPKKSPAGRKPGPKNKPIPAKGDKSTAPPAPLRPARRKVPVGKTVDPYAELKRNYEEQKLIVERIRKDHPDSRIGDPINPLDLDAPRPHEKPLIEGEISAFIKSNYELLADLVDHEHRPSDKVFDEVAAKWANASKYFWISATPAQIAFLSAGISTGMLLSPLAISGGAKIKKNLARKRLGKGKEVEDSSGTN